VRIDDATIRSSDDLIEIVTEHEPGDEVELEVITPEDESLTVTLELISRPRTQLNPED
jgi:PDZ domain-containing secreted protein